MKVSEIKIGETYNGVKVLEDLGPAKGGRRFKCKCPSCEQEFIVRAMEVGNIQKCKNCNLKNRHKDIKGLRFGRLVAIEYLGRKNGHSEWLCKCDCGNTAIITQQSLHQGTISCGCYRKERALLGGDKRKSASIEFGAVSKHPLYTIWVMMKSRCYNPSNIRYKHYGGRGIKVCDRWLGERGFENFVEDMRERPTPKHSLDRIDLKGDYSPQNCRWATYKEQNRNRSNTIYVPIKGVLLPISQICEEYGLNYQTTVSKYKKGQDISKIIAKHSDKT